MEDCGQGRVESGETVDQGGETEAGGEVVGHHLDHAQDVEGGPGDGQEQEGDGEHLGRPALLPGDDLAGAGHLPPHADTQVGHDGALPGQDWLGLAGVAGVSPGQPGESPHVELSEVDGSQAVTVGPTNINSKYPDIFSPEPE